ncbi:MULTISPECIES: pyruvate dehydrogenase (acetyl-transferring) E1 component subunit alpha [unclassified Kribbella]|uniref:pyruvate dehydrogenase (acetyl-transferring) E1 component subunit alpha n=1 Tax=unclassified Kribbella TaxID=2644121 RepID=UPI00301A4446
MTPSHATAESPATKHHTELLRQMLRIRRFEEVCAELYTTTRIRGFLHLYVGEEAVAVGAITCLAPTDALVTTYREHGHALARGISMESVLAEMFGRTSGCSRGRGGSMHLFDSKRRFYGGNAIVAGGLPIATGAALADRLRDEPHVTACFFGDGAVAEGEFHECMNLAALWKLPLLFCCENNLYAMGTALARAQAQTDLALRATSYGMPAWAVDGMDVLAVEEATQRAVETIRGGGGPCFLELRTYRFRAHSMYDSDRYRDKTEIARWKERDPIEALTRRMQAGGELSDDALKALHREVDDEIQRAVDAAETGALEPVEDLTRFVYAERS